MTSKSQVRDESRRFIPLVPKYTGPDTWKEVSSTEEGIMENVRKSDQNILINADALRSDMTKNNVTKYMENHKIALGKKHHRIDLTLFYVFTVAKEYIDKSLFDTDPKMYEEKLVAYLKTLTPSQIGQGQADPPYTSQLKVERFGKDEGRKYFETEKHRDLCKYTLDGYRAHKFLCNSKYANCSWFIAEHVNPWFQDGTLIVVVKRSLVKEGPPKTIFKEQDEMFMYLETPFLFTRTTAVNPDCTSAYYLEKNEHTLQTKNFVTVTRLLLEVLNILFKHYYPEYEWEAYGDFKANFKDFVKYFCGKKNEQLEKFDDDMSKLFSHFWGNVWLNYEKAPSVAQGERYDISQDIFWSDSLPPSPPRVPSAWSPARSIGPAPAVSRPVSHPVSRPAQALPQPRPRKKAKVYATPKNVIIYRRSTEDKAKISMIKGQITTFNEWQEIEYDEWEKTYIATNHYFFENEDDIFSAEDSILVSYLDKNNKVQSKRTNPSTIEAVRRATSSLVKNAINWFRK